MSNEPPAAAALPTAGALSPDTGTAFPGPFATAWPEQVDRLARAAVARACRDHPGPLPTGIHALLDRYPGSLHSRLFAPAVAGALSAPPQDALPVAALSRLWWAGAQMLDDLADSPADHPPTTRTGSEHTLLAMVCSTLLPLAVIDQQPLPPQTAAHWRATLLDTSLLAAAGQLADLASARGPLTAARVMAAYRGKSGAPYGRDAAMAARLATDHPTHLRAWRTFGELFGVIRQLANDAPHQDTLLDADLANGTLTLLLADALENAAPARHRQLLHLRARARREPHARTELRTALRTAQTTRTYTTRITALRRQACTLLDRLAPASPHRDLLHSLLHESARQALGPTPAP
ncbi:polyprenyl synthase [Kitasatospora phosalacinea]|uniref:polyprenyl synthase n=1 Tax=Kitasatospora phosalacinea TaxID=2065 RepID=UPI0036575213